MNSLYFSYLEFIRSELTELETRDFDTLFACIKDNLEDMGSEINDSLLIEALEHGLLEETKRGAK